MKKLIFGFLSMILLYACGSPSGEQQEGSANEDNLSIAEAQTQPFDTFFASVFADKSTPAMEAAIKGIADPEVGLYLVYQEGGLANIKYFSVANLGDLRISFPIGDVLADQVCELSKDAIPLHDCKNGFSGKGCFSGDFKEETFVSKQRKIAVESFSIDEDDIAEQDAKAADAMISTQVIITETKPAMSLYFGQKDGKWILVAVDAVSYICE